MTVGNTTHALPDPFLVFATRNPIEQEGTYPLPEAQLDRFLLEIHVDYPSESEEKRNRAADDERGLRHRAVPIVLHADDVRALEGLVPRMPVTDEAVALAVALGRATRPSGARSADEKGATTIDEVERYVRFGAGPRGSQALVLAAKARAALRGTRRPTSRTSRR